MKLLVIGQGGREHALCWKLQQSPRVTQVFCAPGNDGMEGVARTVAIPVSDHAALIQFAKQEGIALTVVGPDDALAAGIVDAFQEAGLRVFGPRQFAAQFESSKIFAKEFMARHQIPTARYGRFHDSAEAHRFCQTMSYPLVIKADGLALGKGVVIAQSPDEAAKAIYRIMERRQFGNAGAGVVIEEFLTGEECSLHALVDGMSYLLFPGAQDHKQVFNGDQGPNTGGMGTYSPAPVLDAEVLEKVRTEIMDRFVLGLRVEKIEFKGLLFPGLMITADGPKVLEFNCRFGDPETQVLLTRLKSDLVDLLEATLDGRLSETQAEWWDHAAVCVVMASGGYPGNYPKNVPISGLEEAGASATVFHAGTRRDAEGFVTAGGRVVGVTATGVDVRAARDRAYEAVRKIHFDGMHFRDDIALKALKDR